MSTTIERACTRYARLADRHLLARHADVVRTLPRRVHHALPAAFLILLDVKQRVLPVGVDHDVEIDVLLGSSVQAVRQLAGFGRHVDVPAGAVPADVVPPVTAPRNARVRLSAG